MLIDRIYKPKSGELLYHYCGAQAFLSIVASGKMRFSDINMMNDGLEVRLGYSRFEEAATALLKTAKDKTELEGIDIDFFNKVDEVISPKQLYSHSFIACFSKNPDVLSQWRGYGSDGEGMAIGFAPEALKNSPITLLDVLYDPDHQLNEMTESLVSIYMKNLKSRTPYDNEFRMDCQLLAVFLASFKHSTFREEQEVRAIHEVSVEITEASLIFQDRGGTSSGEDVPGGEVRFAARGNHVVAYLDIPIATTEGGAIKEVWLGPKNGNSPGNLLFPLCQAGYLGVAIRRSRSPYR
jgi:hypothetical protein